LQKFEKKTMMTWFNSEALNGFGSKIALANPLTIVWQEKCKRPALIMLSSLGKTGKTIKMVGRCGKAVMRLGASSKNEQAK
jgi:hypothetical protein